MAADMQVLAVTQTDAEELTSLLNAIIARGGTTAHEVPFTPESFAEHFISGQDCIACVKAIDGSGVALGFQSLGFADYAPKGWGDIGTFTRVDGTQRGVGSALFAKTKRIASKKGIAMINATIRADNTGGLAYYSKIGFVDYALLKALPLDDGTLIDRICKKFVVA